MAKQICVHSCNICGGANVYVMTIFYSKTVVFLLNSLSCTDSPQIGWLTGNVSFFFNYLSYVYCRSFHLFLNNLDLRQGWEKLSE